MTEQTDNAPITQKRLISAGWVLGDCADTIDCRKEIRPNYYITIDISLCMLVFITIRYTNTEHDRDFDITFEVSEPIVNITTMTQLNNLYSILSGDTAILSGGV